MNAIICNGVVLQGAKKCPVTTIITTPTDITVPPERTVSTPDANPELTTKDVSSKRSSEIKAYNLLENDTKYKYVVAVAIALGMIISPLIIGVLIIANKKFFKKATYPTSENTEEKELMQV